MSQATSHQHYDLFATYEFRTGNEIKTAWIKAGTGFVNKDGSFNLRLRVLPLTDANTGTANLHMRLALPKEDAQQNHAAQTAEDFDHVNYMPIDPIDGAPLEDL